LSLLFLKSIKAVEIHQRGNKMTDCAAAGEDW